MNLWHGAGTIQRVCSQDLRKLAALAEVEVEPRAPEVMASAMMATHIVEPRK